MGSQPGNREWGSREAGAGGAGAGIFALLLPIGHFTYEMVNTQGEIATDGNVIKLGFENN